MHVGVESGCELVERADDGGLVGDLKQAEELVVRRRQTICRAAWRDIM
jgi:hypothetical protein